VLFDQKLTEDVARSTAQCRGADEKHKGATLWGERAEIDLADLEPHLLDSVDKVSATKAHVLAVVRDLDWENKRSQ
jgi:hypothetical protein